ncbi:hypothetical protein SNEBB_008971 [Seison nebaliae]|nr:hypothetical protein SNEBB_008971 [Seison nebaliae]
MNERIDDSQKIIEQFRTQQCSKFSEHRCMNHRPYKCFDYHFDNHRRRPCVVGKLLYSSKYYCENYDEQSGKCFNGDKCNHLHRNFGDSERLFHPFNYKTIICPYETLSDGTCSNYGEYCSYAHSLSSLRCSSSQMEKSTSSCDTLTGNELDISRRCHAPFNVSQRLLELIKDLKTSDVNYRHIDMLMQMAEFDQYIIYQYLNEKYQNENNLWNDAMHIVCFYKTKDCTKSAHLCRQGFACSDYHQRNDRRRNPFEFFYSSTPCSKVRVNNVWSNPTICPKEDNCKYAHTRHEQQFHPDVYKSTLCHDHENNFCPRGQQCAFHHNKIQEQEERTRIREAYVEKWKINL